MIHFFSFITHTKVAKLVLSGELVNFQPFGILLKGFFVFDKEGYLKDLSYKEYKVLK